MTEQWVRSMETVIEFIETHLDSKLDLEQIGRSYPLFQISFA